MDVYKSFHDFLCLFFVFLAPLLSICASFIILGGWFKEPTHGSKRMKSSAWNCGRVLGEGCSGIIYEATWSRGRHISSSKSLAARKAFPAVPADVFEDEAARLMDLKHPNIVKVLGWTVDRRSCSLFMEHMKYDLFCVVQKRKEAMRNGTQVNLDSTFPIPLREAVHIMLQIAVGVKYVHDQGLAHGDLKPNNVLVDSESGSMVVKVTDFGLTETKKRSTTLVSHQARRLQILKWKAPELFEDLLGSSTEDSEDMWTEMFPDLEAVKLSHASSSATMRSAKSKMLQRADVYSFALTCSYILGARVPHDSNLGLSELRNEIFSGARPHLPFDCPEELRSLISECWHPNPLRRPAFIDICEKMQAFEWEWSILRSEDEYLDPRVTLDTLKAECGPFFFDFNGSGLERKRLMKKRGMAVMYEGEWKRDDGKFHLVLIKIFTYPYLRIPTSVIRFFVSKGTEAHLRTSRVLRPLGATLWENERLALVYERYWGDLRKLIDIQMREKEGPPFKQEMAIDIMLQIAEGLVELHEFGLVHRDVKAANVIVRDLEKFSTGGSHDSISCALTGYELGEWRAKVWPGFEVVEFTPPMDVYRYGMMCYEILTGDICFGGECLNDYDLVLSGRRPELPTSLHPKLRNLLKRCWDADPWKRPTSQEIVLLLKNIQTEKRMLLNLEFLVQQSQAKRRFVVGLPIVILNCAMWML